MRMSLAKFKPLTVLGLMSGTSTDGIDVALLRSDGQRILEPGPATTYRYSTRFRARLRAAMFDHGDLPVVAAELTRAHAEAITTFLARHELVPANIDLVGFHGHTVKHDPAAGQSLQIGDGAALAQQLGIDVVDQFRAADIAAGGQGAPLAPLYHAALAEKLEGPLAVLNIGGVANVTWIGERNLSQGESAIVAFDTGPGNALLDDWTACHTGCSMDKDGCLAARGQIDHAAVERFLTDTYFELSPPKSLDRNAFTFKAITRLSAEDGAATLVAMTAAAAAAATRHFPAAPSRWLVSGGGRNNPAIMAALLERLGVAVEPVESVGWAGDALEAQAFAFLAVRSVRGLPLTLPTTTGVPRPLTGGYLHQASTR